MTSGIYRFINNRTGEVYVGQSFNVYARRGKHHKELTLGTHHNRGLQEDHNRGDTFTFEVLEKMPNATREELEKREIYYIEKFNSFYEGYNQTPGGEYDKYKGRYEYGGDRLPFHKYKPVTKLNACPECGGKLVKRQGEYGKFAGCSNYPDCAFSCSLNKVNFEPKKKYTAHNTNISKSYINQKTIFLKTCKYCNKQINIGLTVCPYCNNDPNSDSNIINEQELIKDDFKIFCSQKKNYLTKSDCDFLSEKYHIDISKANTVKKANPIIKKYLNKTNQWEIAMSDLYYNNISKQIATSNKGPIDETLNWNCPICGSKLKRASKLFVQCEKYPNCSFHCPETYYLEYHLGLKQTPEVPTTKENINKPTTITKNNIFNYCSNCGHKIDFGSKYCENCGERLENTKQKESNSKKDNGDAFGAIFLIILITLFIFSMAIITSDVEGPLSTIASVIFIGILCFGCYISSQ